MAKQKRLIPLDDDMNVLLQALLRTRLTEYKLIEENPALIHLYERALDQLERFM